MKNTLTIIKSNNTQLYSLDDFTDMERNFLLKSHSEIIDTFGKNVPTIVLQLLLKLNSLHILEDSLSDTSILMKDFKTSDYADILNEEYYDSLYFSSVSHRLYCKDYSQLNMKIVEYINNLTIKECIKLYGNKLIKNYIFLQHDTALRVYKKAAQFLYNDEFKIIESIKKNDSAYRLHLTLKNIMTENDDDKTDFIKGFISGTRQHFYDTFDHICINFVINYLKEHENEHIDNKTLTAIKYIVFHLDPKSIIYKNRFSIIENIDSYAGGLIIYYLSKIMSDDEIINIIYDVNSFTNLTTDQWFNFIDHYEEYKDLPVSWWSELVKE